MTMTSSKQRLPRGTPVNVQRRQFLHMAAGTAALPIISRGARAEDLSRAFERQIVIDNCSGAGGIIGLDAAARSAPDGYTVFVGGDYTASVPHVFKLNIDPVQGLEPVVQLSRQPVVLAVHPSLGVNSLAALIALAKEQPGLNYVVGSG